LPGSSDLYTFNQALLLASPNSWNPRPIFQSYSSYNSTLLQLNQQHIIDDFKAPDNIFLKLESIDLRMPTMEDGASWPIILKYYDLTDDYKDYLIFKRKINNKIDYNIYNNLLLSEIHYLNENIILPSVNYPLFITLDIKTSILGNFANLLFKNSPLFIIIELNNGSIYRYRIIPSMTETGFIISPLIRNTLDLKYFINDEIMLISDLRVKAITITPVIAEMKSFYLSKIVNFFWKESFTMNLYKL
jgi:hypothetical protein